MEAAWRLVRCGDNAPNAKNVILLEHAEVVIGRNVSPKYRLDSINVSRNHARLKLDVDGTWSIEDLRSHNGVFVNGSKIPPSCPSVISENDLVGFGKSTPGGDDVYVFRLVKGCKDAKIAERVAPPFQTVDDDDDDVQITAVTNLPAASTFVWSAESQRASARVCAPLATKRPERACNSLPGPTSHVRSNVTLGSEAQELAPRASRPCKQELFDVSAGVEPEDLSSSSVSSPGLFEVHHPIVKQECASTTATMAPKAPGLETPSVTKLPKNKKGCAVVKTELHDTIQVPTDDSCSSHASSEPFHDTVQVLNIHVPMQVCKKETSAVKTERHTDEVPLLSTPLQLRGADRNSPAFVNPLRSQVTNTVPILLPRAVKTEPALELPEEPINLSRKKRVCGSLTPPCPAKETKPHQDVIARADVQASNHHVQDGLNNRELNGASFGPAVAPAGADTASVKMGVAQGSPTTSTLPTKVASQQRLPEALYPHNIQKHVKTEVGEVETKAGAEPAQAKVGAKRKTVSPTEGGECPVRSKQQDKPPSCTLEDLPLLKDCSVVLQPLECALLSLALPPKSVEQGAGNVDEESNSCEGIEACSSKDEDDAATDAGSERDKDRSENFMFSQEDQIIILSDDDDDTCYTLECQVKKEPEDNMVPEETNDNNYEDVDPDEPGRWDLEEPVAGTSTNGETTSVLGDDEELQRRLVWNDADFEDSDTEEAGKDDPQDIVPVQPKDARGDTPGLDKNVTVKEHNFSAPTCSAFLRRLKSGDSASKSAKKKSSLKEQMMRKMKHRVPMAGGGSAIRKKEAQQPHRPDVSDPKSSAVGRTDGTKLDKQPVPQEEFFPVLSQSFFEDSSTPGHISASPTKGTATARFNRSKTVATSPNKSNKLKSVVMRSVNHRISMAGSSSAVRKGECQQPRRPVCEVSTAEGSSKKPHYKSRFQSRTVHLLDEEQSLAAAMNVNRKALKRGAPWPTSVPAKKKADCASVVDTPSEAEGTASAISHAQTELRNGSCGTTESMESPDAVLCSPVLSFKQSRRISRVSSGSQRPTPEAEARVQTKEITTSSHAGGSNCTSHHTKPVVKRTVVSFTELQPSTRTDEERAEFSERARASLRRRKLENSQRCKVNLSTFINFVLGWKVQWLKEQINSPTLPPILDMDKVREKRIMYSSMDEYKIVHYHFLCLEIWEAVFKKWRDFFSRTKRLTFQSVIAHHERPPGDVMILSCMVVVGSEAEHRLDYPMEGHLVRLDLRIKDQEKAVLPVLGFITDHKLQSHNVSRNSMPHLLQPLHAPKCVLISLKIHVKTRDITLNFNKMHCLTVVSKITPTLRQMEAVAELEQSPYGQIVVRPNTRYFWHQTGGAMSKDLLLNFNSKQKEVVSSAVSAMNSPGNDIRILILHGPPGTGKTHALVGMIMGCLHGSSDRSILIVAPSNAAVDEIGRRLLAQRATQTRQKMPGDKVLKLVRVGQHKMIHPEVHGIVLEELVKKNMQYEKRNRLQEYDRDIASKEKHLAQLKRDKITNSGDGRFLHRLQFEETHLEAEILRLTEQKRKYLQTTSRQSHTPYEMKLKVLRKANVVLSTLNSCRSRLLEEAFGRSSPRQLSCVMVDEATQCTEVESLLCLQYRTSRLMLIGDPLQLPATVLSRHAVQRNFQESLFERFYKCLQNEEEDGSRVIFMLTEQRRMHSEICSFPSRYFYGGKLRPVEGLDALYASFPLNPYLVFNVLGSPEMNDSSSTSMTNHGEAGFVVRLCHTIKEIVGSGTSIGVITPYQAQKTAITDLLQQDPSFEVNTVDGFQGQERDVVILSCVRASHPKRCIGFVADARRLNVSITRARKALFVCGHLDTLRDSLEWASLIQDATVRDRVRNVSADCSSQELGHLIAK